MHLAKGPAASLASGPVLRHSPVLAQRFRNGSVLLPIHTSTMSPYPASQVRSALTLFPLSRQSNNASPSCPMVRAFSFLIRAPINPKSGPREWHVQTSRKLSRQFHLSQPQAYDRLQNLEDAANRDRDNANAQAIFLQVSTPIDQRFLTFQALSDKHPEYVVKRYESGSVATNAECDAIYAQALEKISRRSPSAYRSQVDNSISHSPLSQARTSSGVPRSPISQDNARPVFAGMKGNPVHVVVDEGTVR